MPFPDGSDEPLTLKELERLDQLFSAARKFHYTSLVLAGLSLALSSLEQTQSVALPISGLVIPSTQAAVGLYLLVIVLVMATDRLVWMAEPWARYDPRRPPFPWIALGTGPFSTGRITRWLLVPLVACAIATGITLKKGDVLGFTLSFVGLASIMAPRVIDRYLELIGKRADRRGGPATFSIFLLYWYRVLRNVWFTALLFTSVLAIIPNWRQQVLKLSVLLLYILVPAEILRFVGGVGWVYRRIDQFGVRLGFPPKSQHYR
jgi:hypothetical protein